MKKKRVSRTSAATSTALTLVGRAEERDRVRACLLAGKNVLLEGPVGVGKTHLALAITEELGLPVFRVDGDHRYTEQKLAGWFDPPLAIKKGFSKASFIPGPLVEAMQQGGILFINELNRLPEGVQNVLLPSIDERVVTIPRLGQIRAAEGFLVIATQNPKEFVATSHLSEAILDRFELVVLDYQTEEEEIEIVLERASLRKALERVTPSQQAAKIATAAVRIARATRQHPRIRRGASIRAAISVAEITAVLLGGTGESRTTPSFEDAFRAAVLMAFPTRIEIEREAESERSLRMELESLLTELVQETLAGLDVATELKKKP